MDGEATAHSHGPEDHGHHHHSPHLAHHFDSLAQQFSAGKLGMWLFLATEILLFGGLFCAYAVYRANHPEIFIYAHVHLDKMMGGINTCVLIFSSLTMAMAVRCAQVNNRTWLIINLVVTILCGFGFMGIKYFEYKAKWEHGLLMGKYYNPQEHGHEDGTHHEEAVPHGDGHSGLLGLIGFESAFAQDPTAATAAVEASTPPAAVPFEITPEIAAAAVAAASAPAAPPAPIESAPAAQVSAPSGPTVIKVTDAGTVVERSAILPAHEAPVGLAKPIDLHAVHGDEPENVQTFFSIYFAMTGLHGIHVVIGMICIGWILVRVLRGEFSEEYFTPVDLVGLYWHIVDLIWIYLFPLLYLIH